MADGDLVVEMFASDQTPSAVHGNPGRAAGERNDDIVAAQFGTARTLRQVVLGILIQVDRNQAALPGRCRTLPTQMAEVPASFDDGFDDAVSEAAGFLDDGDGSTALNDQQDMLVGRAAVRDAYR